MPENIEYGKALGAGVGISGDTELPIPLDLRDVGMFDVFRSGAPMDYQRPHGWLAAKLFDDFIHDHTNMTAYNFGVVGAAAGYQLQELLDGAGAYNLRLGEPRNAETPSGLSKERGASISQGFNDYQNGLWSKR